MSKAMFWTVALFLVSALCAIGGWGQHPPYVGQAAARGLFVVVFFFFTVGLAVVLVPRFSDPQWVIAVIGLVFLLYIFGAIVLPSMAKAEQGDTWGVATCCSKHSRGEHNERNFGLGFEHEVWRDTRLSAGYFRTSRKEVHIDGTYVLVGHALLTWRPGAHRLFAGAAAGVVSGYAFQVKHVVFPFATYEWNRFVGANASYFKEQDGSKASVFGLQLKTTGRWEPLK